LIFRSPASRGFSFSLGLLFAFHQQTSAMIEKQHINGKEIWLKVDVVPANRQNPNTIPTEYFTASYYTEEPASDGAAGVVILDGEGTPKLFESPVAALTYARKRCEMGEVKSID
jgi:hypothetical protein